MYLFEYTVQSACLQAQSMIRERAEEEMLNLATSTSSHIGGVECALLLMMMLKMVMLLSSHTSAAAATKKSIFFNKTTRNFFGRLIKATTTILSIIFFFFFSSLSKCALTGAQCTEAVW